MRLYCYFLSFMQNMFLSFYIHSQNPFYCFINFCRFFVIVWFRCTHDRQCNASFRVNRGGLYFADNFCWIIRRIKNDLFPGCCACSSLIIFCVFIYDLIHLLLLSLPLRYIPEHHQALAQTPQDLRDLRHRLVCMQ